MMITVEQFARLFKDEKDLREKLIALFRSIPGNQGVRETHGSLERGKDIVFYSHDPISGYRCNACVVKNTQITGSASGRQGAMTVLNQAIQALDNPRTGDDGKPEYAEVVFIISPYDCPESTMLSIQGSLESRRGSIKFLCGGRLLELFEKFHPNALLFDSSFLGHYILQLRSTLLRTDPVRFLMEQSDIVAAGLKQFESVYVKQDFKKALTTYSARTSLYQSRSTLYAMAPTAFRKVIRWIERSSAFVLDDQVWVERKDMTAREVSERYSKLRAKLLHAFEQYLQSLPPGPLKSKLSASTSIPISDSCEKEYLKLKEIIQTPIRSFRDRLDKVNDYVGHLTLPLDFDSDSYREYCAVEDVISRYQEYFEASENCKHDSISRDRIEGCKCPVLITAAAGFGKTSFCKWQILDSIRKLEGRQNDCVPFYIPLHRYAADDLSGSREEIFLQDDAIVNLFKELVKRGRKIRLYFDGLDEVTTQERRNLLMSHAESIARQYQNVSVVVTSRSYIGGRALNWLSRIELNEFSDKQVEELTAKWLGDHSEDYHLFFTQLEESHTLEPLTHIPLMCTLIIAVFRRNRSLPSNRIRLYEIVVDLMCGGWDLAKNIRRSLRFGSDLKRDVLVRFAGMLHASYRRDGDEEEFEEAVAEVDSNGYGRWRELLGEILEDGLLAGAGGRLAFSHLSFQEYLASRDINEPSGELQKRALKLYLVGDDWWTEVLIFLLAVSPRPDEMRKWVTREAKKTLTSGESTQSKVERLFDRIDAARDSGGEVI